MSRPPTIANLHPTASAHTPYPASPQPSPNTKTLTLWIHDPDAAVPFSPRDAVLNYELFPPGVAKPGDVAEVRLIPQVTAPGSGNLSAEGGGNMHISENGAKSTKADRRTIERHTSYAGSGIDEDASAKIEEPKEEEGRFLFVIRELEESQRKLNVQVHNFRQPRVPNTDGFRYRWQTMSRRYSTSPPEAQSV